ncbi:hypothetical protein N7493_010029 [Penicillium malachiteum]|uniref:Uncharacterized protein n=1 Tax=Penicillium malachiteum TaxID=1324776 RepID=A0AAD6HE99_9EURO|nr:hypothetical protein N7493_010029 [Penicillium malachiteum]
MLEGPLPHAFWSHSVPQLAHRDLAVRQATVALGSLYQQFRNVGKNDMTQRIFALNRYNSAINLVANSDSMELDSVAVTSILFTCIELLCGNKKSALIHYDHGKNILDTYLPSPQLKYMFRQIRAFMIFSDSHLHSLLDESDTSHMAEPLASQSPIQDSSTTDLTWSVPLSTDILFFMNRSPRDVTILPDHQALNKGLDTWSFVVAGLIASDDCPLVDVAMRNTLEARSLICNIMTMQSIHGDEAFRKCETEFTRILEIAADFEKMGAPKFIVEIGFPPLLQFVFKKCKALDLRLAALALFKTACCSSKALFDCQGIYKMAKRQIERDHQVKLEPDWAVRDARGWRSFLNEARRTSLGKNHWQNSKGPWVFRVLNAREKLRQITT